MDVLLASFSLDTLRASTWVLAIAAGVLWLYQSPRQKYWQVISGVVQSLLGAASVFLLLNLGVVFYILSHLTDKRWSVGQNPAWTPGALNTDIPIFGGFLQQFNDAQQGIANVVNDAAAARYAIEAAASFSNMIAWAVAVVLLLSLCLFVMTKWWVRPLEKKYQHHLRDEEIAAANAKADAAKAEAAQANARAEQAEANVNELRRQLGQPAYVNTRK